MRALIAGAVLSVVGIVGVVALNERADAKLKEQYRIAMDDLAAVQVSIDAIESAARDVLSRSTRMREKLRTRRSAEALVESTAILDGIKSIELRTKDAQKALAKVDDGEPDPEGALTARANGDLD
jgi:hypothetical protein